MKLLETRIYRGPNLYAYRPVIRLTVDLEELEDYPTNRIPNFTDRLLELLPTLEEHTCSYGVAGGLVRRMREGTWLGHVTEHIAIELQSLAGTPVTYGKTRGTGEPGVYYIVYSYDQEDVGIAAGELAMRLVRSLLPPNLPSHLNEPVDLEQELETLAVLVTRRALGPSTHALVRAAEARGIPWIRLDNYSLVQFGHGKYQKRIQATITSETHHIAVEIAQDKELTIQLLGDVGLPVPRHRVVSTEDEAVEAANSLGYPVVTKPLDASHGRGVSLNLQNEDQVRDGFRRAIEHREDVIVEQFITGRDHRILVINGELIAVAERVPGNVVGDGQHTIGELVEIVNADPRRGVGHEKVLTRIEIDHQARRLMEQAGVTLDTVLPEGQVFYLRSTGNLSTGGTSVDRTDEIHYDNVEMARRAAMTIGLDIAGIDFITPDISRSYHEVGGGIVEVNAAPGFRMHTSPSEGKPRDVARPVIDMLFPDGVPSRIPLAAVTGTNGKTTTARMLAHIMKMSGYRVGLTTTDGIYIDGERYLTGDMTGPWSTRLVLRDPTVDAAVLEVARGGILREGLGFDRCDVGAVLNVAGDHLGLRGVQTLEDLALVKRLIVEVVKPDGYAVLNADDPLVAEMVEHTDGKPFYFSFHPQNDIIREHVRKGGRAIVLEEGVNGQMITLYERGKHIPLVWTHLIPATIEGRAMHNVANAMAAAAMAYALGVKVDNIRQGLRTFATTFFQAPGRLNVFDHPSGFRVIVDYGHNVHAFNAMADMLYKMPVRGRKIGVISAPGDRRDQDMLDMGKIAADMFDYVILREDDNRRGRQPGEIPELLKKGMLDAGFAPANITTIPNELESVQYTLDTAGQDDLVVLFADNITAVWKMVTKHQAPMGEAQEPAERAETQAPRRAAGPVRTAVRTSQPARSQRPLDEPERFRIRRDDPKNPGPEMAD